MSVKAELQNVTAKLVVDSVSKTFDSAQGRVEALKDVSLTVNEGEFVCLVGPSGCGKSTLLNMVAGLDEPDSGRILVEDTPVKGPGRDRMVMFQEHALFPWLDVMGNVMFGLKLKPNLTGALARAQPPHSSDGRNFRRARRAHARTALR